MKKLGVYADTSVIGGCLDPEFRKDSIAFMDAVRAGSITLVLSEIIIRELEKAPPEVQAVLHHHRHAERGGAR